MTDDNPFEGSTLAVVPDMSPEELVFGPPPLSLFEPPSVTDPVSNLDFLPVDDAFALEFRSETIEQLVGGDALRRGESERIEVGRSKANADLVAGRDRVRVHGSLHEHTGHALAEQGAHLHTTVDGALDVHAGSEDTVLLAGHMRDLWDGGAAIVAAMTDDTVAGGGIRVTTPLDLWVHGLMGVEERIGTCTADTVLMESSGTHYEREYGPGVHATGLAVYTGSLYQSSRSSFRPLMRVSSGVRNLIAGGGSGQGGGHGGAGGAPVASPSPAPTAGGAGTQAASATLSAATGAGGTARAGVMAGVRSEDLTGIHRGDEVAALASGANVVGTSGDLTGLRRGTDTAGQLAALRDAMRGGEAGTHGEVRSVSRVSKPDDTASVHEASALDTVADIRSGATVPGMDAPALQSAVSPRKPPPGVKLGLPGGGGDPVRPAWSGFEQWETFYTTMHMKLERHRENFNWIATRAIGDAMSKISAKLIEAYVESGGSIDALKRETWGKTVADADLGNAEFRGGNIGAPERDARKWELYYLGIGPRPGALERDPWGETVAKGAYRGLQDLAREAGDAGNIERASAIKQILASIDQLTDESIHELAARTDEFELAYFESRRTRSLDPRIDAQKVYGWIEEQIGAVHRKIINLLAGQNAPGRPKPGDESLGPEAAARRMACDELNYLGGLQRDVSAGRDPRVGSYNRIRYNVEIGRVEQFEAETSWHVRLLEAMADSSMHRPAVQGSEAAGTATATPRPGDAQAMATSQLGAESTFSLRPVDPVPPPGTVRFDAGLQRAGQQPQNSGEAAIGGTAVHRPFVPTPEEIFDPSHLTVTSSWSLDAFRVERALIAGWLPPGFDLSRLMHEIRGPALNTEFETCLAMGLLPTRAIDSTIERYRAVEGGRGHIQLIGQLEAMKESIDRALTNAYGHRADANWLANVDRFLKSGSGAQGVRVAPVSVASRGEDVVAGARTPLQPARVDSAAPPGSTEGGAGALSPGALSPEEDPWRPPWSQVGADAGALSPGALFPEEDPWRPPWSQVGADAGGLSAGAPSSAQDPLNARPQVRFGEVAVVGFDPTQPVSSLGAGGRGNTVGPTAGWQAAETPGFARLASISADPVLSHREGIVHRLMAGEAVSAAPRTELIRRYNQAISAATIASPAPRARTAAALFEDLGRLFTAARVSPASAAQEDIDWAAIELMLRLLDAPGRSA